MFECGYRSSFNPDHRCYRRGLFGRCVTHHLARCRWEWQSAHFYFSIDLSNMNRPQLNVDEERPIGYVSFDFISDGCDPVVSFGWQRRRLTKECTE